MSLSGVLVALVVPPLNLLPVALAGLALARRGWRPGGAVAVAALLGLFALSLPAVAGLLIASLEDGLSRPRPGAAEAIVILSAEGRTFGPDGILSGEDVGGLTLERLRAGAVLHRATGLPLLVSGGVLEDGRPAIAATMARVLARDFNVPVRWVEPHSRDTWENASDSAAMLRRDGIGAVLVVTHGWHMRRALLSFARAGLPATPAATGIEARRALQAADFAPSATAWLRSYWALHEWIGCAVYAWRGPNSPA